MRFKEVCKDLLCSRNDRDFEVFETGPVHPVVKEL